MAYTENFDDGSYTLWFDDGGYETYSPDGYKVDSYYPTVIDHPSTNQAPGWLTAIGDIFTGVVGHASQTGYYAPNRSGQPIQNTRQNFGVPGAIPPTFCNGIQIGGSVSALGGGTQGGFCLTKSMMLLGGAGLALFLLGQKRGRR